MIVNALSGKPLPVYGDGSNIRDWLYVEDHVRAIELILESDRVGETYNVGGNEEHANLDIVQRLCAGVDAAFQEQPELAARFPDAPAAKGQSTESLVTFVKDRPGHDWRYAIDAAKIETELGFEPRHDFESGLASTIQWMLDNEAWWRAVMDGSYREWIDTQYVAR